MTKYPCLLLSAAVFLGWPSPVRAVTPEEGRRIYLEAKEGNAESQYRLGLCYLKGDGVKRNPSQAKLWFSKAAKQGHRTAERSLRLIPKKAPLPVDSSIDRATREKKGLELYEYLYKLKDYKPEKEVAYTSFGRQKKGKFPAQGTPPDLSKVSALIRAGADVNYQGEDTNSHKSCPLALAVNMEHYELADLLIANGADVNLELTENGKFGTSFSLLSRYSNDNQLFKAKYLLENGADPDYVRESGYPVLVWAARHGQEKLTALLLEYGADPNKTRAQPHKKGYKPGNGETALWAAANSSNTGETDLAVVTEMLIRHKADVNRRAKDGTTALDQAIATKKKSLEHLLRAAGAKTSRELKQESTK